MAADAEARSPPGSKFLIFAYKEKDGKLWTGMCSGNQKLSGSPDDERRTTVREYQELIKKGSTSILGHIFYARPSWQGDDLRDDIPPQPQRGTQWGLRVKSPLTKPI